MTRKKPGTLGWRGHWRFGTDGGGTFDELALAGGLVHLEMMDAATCWVKVGSQHCTINLRTGKATPFEDYS